jgi:hypothetical protein
MDMKIFLLVAAMAVFQAGFSQDRAVADSASRSVIVRKDPRVDLLVKRQAATNAAVKKSSARTARGYRLMVMSTNKRDEAISAKSKLYSYYPDLKSYLIYQSPFFKLKVGNFKTRDEAEKYRKSMAPLFPKGVFIVNDVIEVKPEKEEES